MFLSLQRKLSSDMKKLTFIILFLSALSLNACNTSGNGDKNSGDASLQAQPASSASAGEGKVIVLNSEQFRALVWDYKKSPDNWVFKGELPAVVDFYADWCRPCRLIAPIMDELASEYKGKVNFYKVNTDLERELSAAFNIRSIPAVLFVPKAEKPQMSVGAQQKPAYIQAIQEVLKVK